MPAGNSQHCQICLARPLTFAISLFLALLLLNCASDTGTSTSLTLIYTANLNGALDDCKCGGDTVGGMDRISTILEDARAADPHLLLFDGGDFSNSYSHPTLNKTMLSLLQNAGYDAINPGDQEFLDDPPLLGKQDARPGESLPILMESAQRAPVRLLKRKNVEILIVALADTTLQRSASNEAILTKPEKILDRAAVAHLNTDLQILLYHGPWPEAEKLAMAYPWLDIIILGHNRYLRERFVGSCLLVEPGVDGEFIGEIDILLEGDQLKTSNRFRPVTLATAPHPTASSAIVDYYRQTGIK